VTYTLKQALIDMWSSWLIHMCILQLIDMWSSWFIHTQLVTHWCVQVLQCVVVCCSVLQTHSFVVGAALVCAGVAARCSALQCVADSFIHGLVTHWCVQFTPHWRSYLSVWGDSLMCAVRDSLMCAVRDSLMCAGRDSFIRHSYVVTRVQFVTHWCVQVVTHSYVIHTSWLIDVCRFCSVL